MLPKVFTGGHPLGELAIPVITSKIINGGRSARLQEAQGLGLTDSVWEMVVHCLHQVPIQRPTMTEVVRLARKWSVFHSFCGTSIMTRFPQLQHECFASQNHGYPNQGLH